MHSKENLLLNPDFIDILAAFSEEKVEYLVIGGYAMAFHGYVRGSRERPERCHLGREQFVS